MALTALTEPESDAGIRSVVRYRSNIQKITNATLKIVATINLRTSRLFLRELILIFDGRLVLV